MDQGYKPGLSETYRLAMAALQHKHTDLAKFFYGTLNMGKYDELSTVLEEDGEGILPDCCHCSKPARGKFILKPCDHGQLCSGCMAKMFEQDYAICLVCKKPVTAVRRGRTLQN